MMRFLIKKVLFTLFLVFFSVANAQSNGPGAPCFNCNPTSPIDMYVYVLGIIGIVFILYFAKKYKAKKI
ncbi:hypothetical protein AR685_15730 [Chryseobacterium sp. JAH]|nr:hypothetical protein AR685_15730 [Chryseobacterium sp. JAH]